MGKKQRQTRAFSIIASLIMVFSLIAPGLTFAESNGNASQSLRDSKAQVENKVTSSLQKQLESDEKVTFLIKFTETTDTMKVAEQARESAQKANLSAMNQEFQQRSAVISALKQTAMESQGEVLDFLAEAEKEGLAEDVKPYHIVNGVAVTATKEVAEKLTTFQEVEKLLPNEQRQLIRAVETDAEVPENQTAEVEWNIDRVGAPAVWDMGIDGQGAVVASIDTGADWEHPALKNKYRGYDPATGEVDHTYSFYDPVNGEEVPYDDDSHGTHVTGTMVGSEADGSNQIGVAPGAEWISVQAFTPQGAYDTDLLDAAQWILAPGGDASKAPDVVNNSWGGGPGLDEWYRDAVTAWRAADIFPAFAAGNTTLTNPGGPGSVAVPANYPESFATGSTNSSDAKSTSSLEGPSPYEEIKPDIAAPGEGIRSSIPGGGYGGKSGTSMASPAVAGVVALLKSANAGLDVDTAEEILMEMADSDAGTDSSFPESPNNGYGHGIVDAYAAVSSVISGLGTIEGQVTMDGEDNEAPTYNHEAPAEAYTQMDLELAIEASDNVSVTSVELHYGDETVEATRTDGDFRDGTYSATIPGEVLEEGTFSYHWVVRDFGGNDVTSDSYEVNIVSGITTGYEEDFEGSSAPAGWLRIGENNVWEWGEPTTGPGEAYSGENVYATNLDSDYVSNMDATLVMPPVDVPEEGEAYLQFKSWHHFEQSSYGTNWDYGYLRISTDMENWTNLQLFEGEETSWQDVEIDLSDYLGERVYIGFYAYSDGSVTRPGWFIDDVALSDTLLGDAPTNMSQEVMDKKMQSDEKEKKEEAVSLGVQQAATPSTSSDSVSKEDSVQSSGIPLAAQVSVLETDRSVNTNPQDGSYNLMHAAGEFTLVAEAYGFSSGEQTVSVEADESTTANFVLDELEQGTVTGTVTNERTGEPIEGATLLLAEDANIDPVQTDASGNFTLTGYEGTYTLKIVAANFHSKEVEIDLTGEVSLDIEMEPFYTVPGGEIYYDDGTAENARAYYDAGNKWAVKMSLPEGKDQALVTDGVFQFHGTDWPLPGDTPFAVEVWSAGDDGMPDERLAGPIDAEAIRDLNEWTVVDLREESIQVEGDFFMVYVQTQANPNVPGLATDENGPNAGRSYQEVGGVWSASPTAEGNYMIRARVAYEVDTPAITSFEDGEITNETEVTVEGTASPDTTVEIEQNGEVVGSAEIDSDGTFAIDTELDEGANEFVAVTYIDGENATESDPITLTLDTEAPDVTIDTPSDGDQINRETATVEGTVQDAHLDTVTVNGRTTNVADDGSFSQRILLDNGENVIEVEATDLAGNVTTETVTVDVKFTAPEISNLTPAEDVELNAGESVMIQFESEPGLRASYVLHMPLTNLGLAAIPQNATELPMMEISPGTYIGYYTATSNVEANGAVVEVKVSDSFGNETREQAEGKLYINVGE